MTATASHYTDARPGNGAERSGPSAGRGGRQPPHNLAAERSLLGSMLLSPAAIGDALQRLDASDFYQPAHSHVFDAIAGLYAAGSPVDSVLVADQLTRNSLLDSIGGVGTIIELQGSAAAVSNAAYYAKVVEENALLRRLIATASEISELGFQPADDVSQTMDRAESLIYQVAQRRVTDTLVPLRDLLGDTLDRPASPTSIPSSMASSPAHSSCWALVPPWARPRWRWRSLATLRCRRASRRCTSAWR